MSTSQLMSYKKIDSFFFHLKGCIKSIYQHRMMISRCWVVRTPIMNHSKIALTCVKTSTMPICRHFQNEKHISNLIRLYGRSQRENSRNNRLTPEIGTAREKDLVASLLSNPDLAVTYDIPNESEEDVIVDGEMISIKHSSNKKVTSRGIKVIWTSNELKQSDFVRKHVWGKRHLLLSFVRFKDHGTNSGELEIILLDKTAIHHQQHLHLIREDPVFKCLKGNCRGIEFFPSFFNQLILNCEFHVKIDFDGFDQESMVIDPIQHRLTYLKALHI